MTKLFKRLVLLSLFILIAVYSLAALDIKMVKVSDHVTVFQVGYKGGATILVSSDDGLVVVDTNISHRIAGKIRALIEKNFPGKKIKYVINTHSHFDHVMGNQVYPVAIIIGHENIVEEIKEQLTDLDKAEKRAKDITKRIEDYLPKVDKSLQDYKIYSQMKESFAEQAVALKSGFKMVLPSLTFKKQTTIHMSDVTLELYHYPKAHTASDVVIYIPQDKVLLSGDLFLSYQYAVLVNPELKDFPVEKWLDTLDMLISKKDIKHVITSHGSINTLDFLKVRRRYIGDLWKDLNELHKAGKKMEDAEKALTIKDKYSYLKSTGITMENMEFVNKGIIKKLWEELDSRAKK